MLLALLTPISAGCATVGPAATAPAAEVARVGEPERFTAIQSGDALGADRAMDWLAEHAHVYVGEHHGDPVSHQAQLMVCLLYTSDAADE